MIACSRPPFRGIPSFSRVAAQADSPQRQLGEKVNTTSPKPRSGDRFVNQHVQPRKGIADRRRFHVAAAIL